MQGTKTGLAGLVTPYSTTEFHAMVEASRSHFHSVHDQLVVVGAELYRGLAKVSGNPWLLGVDSKVAAKRVTKHLYRAAGEELNAAKSVVRAYTQFLELFKGAPSGAHARSFNLDK